MVTAASVLELQLRKRLERGTSADKEKDRTSANETRAHFDEEWSMQSGQETGRFLFCSENEVELT